jgi:small subunit ribosomal protein S6e
MVFKIVISDPKSRKAYQKEVEEGASGLIGKKVGDKVSGGFLGLEGYEIEITGGSDKEGFPIRPDVDGPGRKKIVLAFPPGFHAVRQGERKRKSVRGNTISKDISQINMKVVKAGSKPLDVLLGAKEKKEKPAEGKEGEKPAEEKAEAKAEAPKEEKPAESKEAKPEAEAPKEEAKPEEKPAEEKMGVKTLEEKESEAPKKGEPARKEEVPQGGEALEKEEKPADKGKKPEKEKENK